MTLTLGLLHHHHQKARKISHIPQTFPLPPPEFAEQEFDDIAAPITLQTHSMYQSTTLLDSLSLG